VFARDVYFDSVRQSLFSGALTQQQVDGQNAILTQWEDDDNLDLRWLSYSLATVFHECAKKMWPIEEIGKGKGRKYGIPDPETGQTYYGRGFVQLTWKENYQKATVNLGLSGDRDLVRHPEKALDLVIASKIMFRGMAEGWFTGKKLGQYFSKTTDDPFNARAIINADKNTVPKGAKHSIGEMIVSYHDKFLSALKDSVQSVLGKQMLVALTVPDGVEVVVSVNGDVVF
jgi:hypothetical protein